MIVGRITRKQMTRTSGGLVVGRLAVVNQARGPASRPVRVDLYAKEGEAKRWRSGLGEGDLIEAVGDLGPQRDGVGHQELLVGEGGVKLYERAGQVAAA
jgi:hypothetical protein